MFNPFKRKAKPIMFIISFRNITNGEIEEYPGMVDNGVLKWKKPESGNIPRYVVQKMKGFIEQGKVLGGDMFSLNDKDEHITLGLCIWLRQV